MEKQKKSLFEDMEKITSKGNNKIVCPYLRKEKEYGRLDKLISTNS